MFTHLAVCLQREQQVCPQFIDGLFSMVPNVKKYEDFGTLDPHLLTAAIANLKLDTLLVKNGSIEPAKDFCAIMTDQKLKRLEIGLCLGDEADVQACEEFFTDQSDTLERLTLTVRVSNPETEEDVDKDVNVRMKLPLMKTLNQITLKCDEAEEGSCIGPIQSKNIPSLRKLKLGDIFILEDFIVNDEFSSVEELNLGSSSRLCRYDGEQLRRIGTTFPNLRKINIRGIRLRDGDFPVVFSLGQLEDLHLEIHERHLEKNINYTLSGLPVESAWFTTQLIAAKSQLISSLERTQASLQTMKCLKGLTLKFYALDVSNPFVIDEVGVHFGFLSMPRLQHLKLLGAFTISDDGAAELKKFLYSVVIDPNPKIEDKP